VSDTIVLSQFQVVDVFFRCATVGVLALLFIVLRRSDKQTNSYASLVLLCCLGGYALLTAPVEDAFYGWVRPPLLLLTNFTPYALLAVYWIQTRGKQLLSSTALWLKLLLACWFVWLLYFFIAMQGVGRFLDVQHGIGLCILAGIVVDAIRGLEDDLVERRRDIRKLAIAIITVYATALTTIEIFFRWVKNEPAFSLANAIVLFTFSLVIGHRLVLQKIDSTNTVFSTSPKESERKLAPNNPLLERLTKLMSDGFFEENGLTISKLATKLAIPEHQLRVLINKELGFENFSQFLNSYRIPAICEKLQDPNLKDQPILTLALETGYNSIAPFNRAFKEQKGVTPTEYRNRFE
jgi:AraC-like DNA-binding protein